jgi:hypothetical protein
VLRLQEPELVMNTENNEYAITARKNCKSTYFEQTIS